MCAYVVVDVRALIEADVNALAGETVFETASAHSKSDLIAAIDAYFGSTNEVAKQWAKEFVSTNGELPGGPDLARFSGLTAANCRKWITPVRKALGLS